VNSNTSLRAAIILIAIAIACSAQIALGQYTFVQDTDSLGNWNDVANWLDGGSNTTFPNAVGATVLFNAPVKTPSTGTYTLTLPAADVTVGELKIDNTGFTNTSRIIFASGGGKLVFQAISGAAKYIETPNTGTAPQNSQNQIQANLLLNSDLEITQDNYPNLNTGTTFTGITSGDSLKTITKKGTGGIQYNYGFPLGPGEGFEGQYVVQNGSIRLVNSTAAISKSSGFTVQSGGQLQLADNAATAVPNFNMAPGAVLNLNGPGRAASQPSPEGALRFGITAGRTATFHNPVNLQSDSQVNVGVANTFGVFDNVVSGGGDLIKAGPGQLTLTSNNIYTGDTQIVAGILSVTNPYLADAADVFMTTGAKFNLNFVGTDAIRSLYFDGTPQPIGTYGATGSGAANINDAFFSGSGILIVTSAVPEPATIVLLAFVSPFIALLVARRNLGKTRK
jgi:autotransporter-associated beta strand protein